MPLLLLTADRPVELRDTGANQTLRQPGLLAGVTRWTFDVAAPSPEVDPAFVLTTAGQAVLRAESPPGPVHLNLAFREPLAPSADAEATLALPARLNDWARSGAPYTWWTGPPTSAMPLSLKPSLGDALRTERGLIVLGGQGGASGAETATLDLAARLGWPVWSDLLGGARFGPKGRRYTEDARVVYGDAVLSSPERVADLRPDTVLYLGARAMSKRLQQALVTWAPDDLVVIDGSPERLDPDHRATMRVQLDPGSAARVLANTVAERDASAYRAAWLAADAAVGEIIEREVAASGLSEPFVARAVTRLVPEHAQLVAAASMPVRDLDTYGAADGPAVWRVVANRGASGIDGTVATAVGVARASIEGAEPGDPVPVTVLLTGDLALLHDLTSLALLRDGPPVVVVCVNNDGGGIFHQLPVAQTAPPAAFERMFGTPHGLGFEAAAAFAGLPYARPETAEAFEAAFADAVATASTDGASALVEVRTDRAEQTALRRRIQAAVAAA